METGKLDNDFFEKVVIYNTLVDDEYLSSIVDFIRPIYFKDKDVRSIIQIITDFHKSRNTCPTTTEIKAYLTTEDLKKSFTNVVTSFKNIDRKFNKDELYSNTEKFIKEKAVYNTMLEVVDECTKRDIDTSSILSRFEAACNLSLTSNLGLEYFKDLSVHIDDLERADKYIPTGWDWLDRKLGGGFLEDGRSLYVFAGQTNVGKSIFLGNIAVNVASQGRTVLLVTLEMPEMMYAKRLSSQISQIPIGQLQTKTNDLREKVTQFRVNHPQSRLIIKEFPPNTISPNQLDAYIKKLYRQNIEPDLIILDYLNLMHSPVGTNSYERVKYATEQVRALSYTYQCPIVSATQINRGGFDQIDPGMDTISESVGLASTADCIFSIWQEDEDRDLGRIQLGIMKNRFGPNFGYQTMRINYSTLTLEEDTSFNDTESAQEATSLLEEFKED
jgi:replicative DNA helicase